MEAVDAMRKIFGENKKKITIRLISILIGICIMSGIVIFYVRSQDDQTQNLEQNDDVMMMDQTENSSEMISASGTTVVGMLSEEFELDFLSNSILVEEVYVSSGDELQEGTPILKVSEDDVEEAREELEKAKALADLDYRSGVIDYEQGKIDTKEEYDLSIAEGDNAKTVYNQSIASLEENIEKLKEEVEDAKEIYDEYYLAASNGEYYLDYYEVEEKLALYNENEELYTSKLIQWGISENQLNASGMSSGGSDNSVDYKWKIMTLYLLKQEVAENEKEYQQAVSNYEKAKKELTKNYKESENTYNTKILELEAAKLSYEEDKVKALADYESTVAKGSAALATYDTAIKKLKETFDTLQDAKEEADDNLTLFESTIGDTYYYASNNGSVLMVGTRVNRNLEGNSMILAYSNPDTVTVTVSVDQSKIALLTVGDSAYVSISGKGNYEGSITQIEPTTSSDSKTSITYNVTVTLAGDVTSLSANLTAQVIFGMEEGN